MVAGDASQLLVHQAQPLNAETPPKLLRHSFLTSQDCFYVRTHGSVPVVDAATYRVLITGEVQRTVELSLDELRALSPARTVTATLECAGNRRAELTAVKPIPGEVPWQAGVIGTAEWRGVPLTEVLRVTGLGAAARHVAFTSLDETTFEGQTVSYGSSVALDKALSPDVILAYEMNGEALTPEHGFPLRVIVPGYIGARSVKWLRNITLQELPSSNPYQARDYKVFPPEVTEATVDWSRGTTLESLSLNSVITTPQEGETVAAGPRLIRGYALAGEEAQVERIELSIDGGQTWTTADIVESAGPYAWCFWEVRSKLSPGDCALVVRAWDESGRTQPRDARSVWNFKGYMNNAWQRVEIRVTEPAVARREQPSL